MKYICWGDDHEDLTEKVFAAIKDWPPDYSAKIRKMKKVHRWRVTIECSKDHENIFEGELNFPERGDFALEKMAPVFGRRKFYEQRSPNGKAAKRRG